MKTVSLTKRWKKLSKLDEPAAFTVPVPLGPGRAVYKIKGNEIWARWESAITP